MKKILILLLALSFDASGEIPIDYRASDYFGALNMSFEQKFRAKEAMEEWSEKALALENSQETHLKDNCFSLPGGEVILILQIEESGIISEVYAGNASPKSECFINSYKGEKLPNPPIAPLYKLQRML